MPLVTESTFRSPKLLSNGHLQTIVGVMSPCSRMNAYSRERITTPDGEILSLDWLCSGSPNLVIVCHGLEGSSDSSYVVGLSSNLHQAGWDVAACNMRGNGGETSRTPTFSHAGSSNDLRTVLNHIPPHYQSIALVGFSLGGNILLKYLGEEGISISPRILAACIFSVPCDLKSTAYKLAHPSRLPYMLHFLWCLKRRITRLTSTFPDHVKPFSLRQTKTFRDFDENYTAPLHGFAHAEHYWSASSALNFIEDIAIPTLIVNSQDDPFLDRASFPLEQASAHQYVFLETPKHGGHIGFMDSRLSSRCWLSERSLSFFSSVKGET